MNGNVMTAAGSTCHRLYVSCHRMQGQATARTKQLESIFSSCKGVAGVFWVSRRNAKDQVVTLSNVLQYVAVPTEILEYNMTPPWLTVHLEPDALCACWAA